MSKRNFSQRPHFRRDRRRPPGLPRPTPRRELKPMPINKKCNPLCPFFRCGKRALIIQTKYIKGHNQKIPFCSWIGDTCISHQCQYAYCTEKALLPDGTCAFVVREEQQKKKKTDMLEEIAREDLEEPVKKILTRKFGIKTYDEL